MDEPNKSILRTIRDLFRKPPEEEAAEIAHEIEELINEGERRGIISAQEGEMIESILHFRNKIVREVMIPRSRMVCLDLKASLKEAVETAVESGHSRIPIYEADLDHIAGILHVKDLLRFCLKRPEEFRLQDLLRPAYIVPETKRIGELLREFRERKSHMAVVIDEYGSVSGLVTFEDVLEEIVGEIEDEHDRDGEDLKETETGLIVAGHVPLEEVEEALKLSLPEGRSESIGGLVIEHLGHLPSSKEKLRLGPVEIEILEADSRRIRRLRIKKAS
ncbi:hemolysin family protein [Thermosulfuriphilus sp.]